MISLLSLFTGKRKKNDDVAQLPAAPRSPFPPFPGAP